VDFVDGDIRFIVSDDCWEAITHVCDAASLYMANAGYRTVVVCHDARLSSPAISRLVVDRCMCHGLQVMATERPVSTCLFYQTCRDLHAGGIMITASHNPKEYNGLKMVHPTLEPISSNELVPFLSELKSPTDGKGTIRQVDHTPLYAGTALQESHLSKDTKASILIDFLNGSASVETLAAFRQLPGITVTALHEHPDGSFPCGEPNPLSEKSISSFRTALKEHPFDLGFVLDGDGDRIGVFLPDGRRIQPYTILTGVFATGSYPSGSRMLLDGKTPQSFFTASVDLSKTGHGAIKKTMLSHPQDQYVLACEGSGHYFYRMQNAIVENSLLSMLFTLGLFTQHRTLLMDLVRRQEATFIGKEMTIHSPQAKSIGSRVTALFQKRGSEIISNDRYGENLGYQLIRGEGFSLYQRVSQTETDTLRWQVNAKDQMTADAVTDLLIHIQKEDVK